MSATVTLNVYDLANNTYTHNLGIGVYHSGIVVYGQEWSYGGADIDGTGVFCTEPGAAEGCILRETITLGDTPSTPRQVERILRSLADEFPARRYSLVKCNCNHFTDAAARRLLNKGIPSWVNRLAYLGTWVSFALPPHMVDGEYADAMPAPTDASARVPFQGSGRRLGEEAAPSSSSSSSTALFSSILPSKPSSSSTTTTTTTSTQNQTESKEERRRKLLEAAQRRLNAPTESSS